MLKVIQFVIFNAALILFTGNLKADLINAFQNNLVMTPEIAAQNESSLTNENNATHHSIDQIINNMIDSFNGLEDYSATFIWTSYGALDNRTQFAIKNNRMFKSVTKYQDKVIGMETVKIFDDKILKSWWDSGKNVVHRVTIKGSPESSDLISNSNPLGMIANFKNNIISKAKYSIRSSNYDNNEVIIVTFDDMYNEPRHKSAVYIRKSDWMLIKYEFFVGNIDSSIYEWKDIKINQGLMESYFDLDYPKDAKVIDQIFPNRWVVVNNDNEMIKPITYSDEKTGIVITVESDGRHVSASKMGKILWRKDPFVDSNLEPYRFSKPIIANIVQVNKEGRLGISYNSTQFGEIDLLTGNFDYFGQD